MNLHTIRGLVPQRLAVWLLAAAMLLPGASALASELDDLRRRVEILEGGKPGTPPVSADDEGFVATDQSGNDPRDFGSKFMPYYRYTKLDNDIEVNEMTLFGFFAFNARFGMTYELPLAKRLDYNISEFRSFKATNGCPPAVDPGTGLPPIGEGGAFAPFADLDCDGDEIGLGDLGLRFFVRPRQLEWTYGNDHNFTLIPVVEMTMPTATEDILGGESFILSPGIVPVFDLPFDEGPLSFAFFAMMNFFDFDAYKDDDRGRTERFRGRWFYMQPFSPPTDEMSFFDLSGLYMMTEFQPVYDFVQDHFSFWVGPEFGKIVYPGLVFYGKPGWGVDPSGSKGDRQWTFEFGFRYFFD